MGLVNRHVGGTGGVKGSCRQASKALIYLGKSLTHSPKVRVERKKGEKIEIVSLYNLRTKVT